MSKPVIKMSTTTSWTVGYLRKIMEFLPDDTKVTTNFGIITHGLRFELPAEFGVETTVKVSQKIGGGL